MVISHQRVRDTLRNCQPGGETMAISCARKVSPHATALKIRKGIFSHHQLFENRKSLQRQ